MEQTMQARYPNAQRARQRGQSLPEFLIVVPVFIFLVLLIFQLVLVYRAKTTLDYATLMAARAGAVNHAEIKAMEAGLVKGLTPLYATSSGAVGLGEAWAKTRWDLGMDLDLGLVRNAKIEIISPTRASWNEFKERQYNGKQALPNDNLAFRDHAIGASGVNVQDANILKIRVMYDYPLIVPFVDLVLRGESKFVKSSGYFDPANVKMKSPLVTTGRYYRIPLESYAIVRMQTPIYESELKDLP